VAIVLSLLSALMCGVSDYVGGRASRRVPAVTVALFAGTVMRAMCVVAIPLIEDEPPPQSAVVWGLVAGLMGSVAVVGLYLALARGNMTIVAPVTGVVAAVVPVAVGVATGERPGMLAVAGIVVAILAVALVGGIAGLFGGRGAHRAIDLATVVLAIAVGIGFGLLFVAFSRTGDDSGLWSLLFARFSGLPLLAAYYVVRRRRRARTGEVHAGFDAAVVLPGLAVGALIVVGNAAYVLATREDLLSIVAVVVSMYPAATVGLAAAFDGERASRSQVAGMVLAVGALLMITIDR